MKFIKNLFYLKNNNQINDNETNDYQINDNETNDNQINDNQISDNKTNDNETNDNETNDNQIADNETNDNQINEDILNKPNIRNKQIKNIYKKYAFDINYVIDIDKLKFDLSKFKLINNSISKGFTSIVNIYEYNNYKIVEKIYKYIESSSECYVDDNFINESFYNEVSSLNLLKNESNFPKIIDFNKNEKKIYMTYTGNNIGNNPDDIDLSKIPKDWKMQLYYILKTFKKYNLYHNDITCRNICLLDNTLYLIDFGNCKKFIDLYYRNFYLDMLINSDNIIAFLKLVDKNAMEIRKCCNGNL